MLACGYRNERAHLVILRSQGINGSAWERVIFPFELLTFLAPAQSSVLIYGPTGQEADLLEEVPVDELLIESRLPVEHPGLPSSMEAMLKDMRLTYSRDPSVENRHRLTRLEQSLAQHLPGWG